MKLIRHEQPDWSALLPENWLNRWFGESFGSGLRRNFFGTDEGFEGSGNGSRSGALRANLYEDGDHYYARFELPGVRKEELNVELHNAVLAVTYCRHAESEANGSEGEKASVTESYSRSVSLPEDVKADGVSAKFEDGILTVSVPKAEARQPRQISIG